MTYCTATRSDGSPCRAQALPGEALCWAHHPEMRRKADEARRRGGENKSNLVRASKRLPKDLKDVQAILLELIRDLHGDEGLDLPSKARGVSQLAGVFVRTHELAEVEGRIEDLEQRLEQRPQQARR